ncbi:MAG TPA: alpha/beta hydrolase [Microbacterium sp.]|nr:alpha/beta hydrolase [Microbacterium sp.]
MTAPATLDEFAFLSDDARDQGAAVPAVRRDSLTLDDGRTLSALLFGDGRPRVVFIHGAGLNAHTWDRTIIDLAEPALAIDLPGHGDSSWRDDADYSPERNADAVVRAIEHWADAPVVLVGHSLGGLTSIHVAARRPDLVAHLTLVDILPGIGGSGRSALAPFYERLEFASVDDVLDHALAFGLGGEREKARRGVILNTRTRDDGVVEWKHHMARILSDAAPDQRPLEIDDDRDRRALDAVSVPTSLIAGARGLLSPEQIEAFASARPGNDALVLDAPHNVQETSHLDLARAVRASLSGRN